MMKRDIVALRKKNGRIKYSHYRPKNTIKKIRMGTDIIENSITENMKMLKLTQRRQIKKSKKVIR